ncbi:MAG: TauD/TfdA dioxygenase family protein [Acidimicrobiia bacterium]
MLRGVTITPLTGSIGARVTGVDLRDEVPHDVATTLRDAFVRYGVLVVAQDGDVGADEQVRLAALFGEPQPLAVFQFLGALSAELTLDTGSSIAATGDAAQPKPTPAADDTMARELRGLGLGGGHDGWHADSTFTPWIPRVAVLRAELMPPVGGDTGFTSLCAAYDALSPTMRRFVEDLTAVHVYPDGYKDVLHLAQYGADAEARFDAEYPPREWPVVIEHPESGRRSLFLNGAYTVHVMGLTRGESNAVLSFLFAHVRGADFQYRHHWSPGDLVLWDEVTVLHRAPGDVGTQDRKVVRVTAGRCVPAAPKEPLET